VAGVNDVDKAARARAKREHADRARADKQAQDERVAQRRQLVADARSLTERARVHLMEHATDAAVPFRLRRTFANRFAGHRGGWFIGGIRGPVGHGESGVTPVYLLSSGEFIWGGNPHSNQRHTPTSLSFFADSVIRPTLLEDLVALLRALIEGDGAD
jgi:hypothetical protein